MSDERPKITTVIERPGKPAVEVPESARDATVEKWAAQRAVDAEAARDAACKHIGQSVICPFCRERILMCPASERDAARQDAERARGLLETAVRLIRDVRCSGSEVEQEELLGTHLLEDLRAFLATPTPGPVPPEALAVLRDTSITLPGEELAINAALDSGVRITEAMQQVIARGCRACMQAEHPYWHPADRPCPKSDTP